MSDLLASHFGVLSWCSLVNAQIVVITSTDYFSLPAKLMDLATIYITVKRQKKD